VVVEFISFVPVVVEDDVPEVESVLDVGLFPDPDDPELGAYRDVVAIILPSSLCKASILEVVDVIYTTDSYVYP
jgi:hypothetical protein